MANTYKDIIITANRNSNTADPNISFRGANSASNTEITLRMYPDSNGTLSFEGSAGQLFSITNDLTGSLYSVNDVSGIPSLEVFANGEVRLAQYSGNVKVGSELMIMNTGTSVISATYGNIFTTSAVTSYTVDTFPAATYRSAKYFAQQTSGTTYGVIELNLVHDGTTVYLAQYGENKTNSSANLGVFDASISSGSLNLTYTPGSVYTAQTLKISRVAIAN